MIEYKALVLEFYINILPLNITKGEVEASCHQRKTEYKKKLETNNKHAYMIHHFRFYDTGTYNNTRF